MMGIKVRPAHSADSRPVSSKGLEDPQHTSLELMCKGLVQFGPVKGG